MTVGLDGSAAVITGAAGDIGRAVARRLASAGAHVVLADRPEAEAGLAETESLIDADGASGAVSRALFDVTDEAAVAAAFDELDEPARLLVNNAGLQGEFANTSDVSLDLARRVLDVNVIGVLTVLQAFARRLQAVGGTGAVVNTASMAGVSGAPNMIGYSASKAAVIALTKSAAKDLAPSGIRVNAVSPGFIGPGTMWTTQVERQAAVASRYYADDPEAVAEQMIAMVPLGRYGSLDEVASTIHFLLSDDASFITGTNTEIAGGSA